VIHGALFERDPNFTPVKIYRKRINIKGDIRAERAW
jgi:hypothetical protein